MSTPQTDQPDAEIHQPAPLKPLRLWPGVVAVVLQWLGWAIVPVVYPEAALYGMMGALLCAPAIIVWWFFFSRVPWVERIGAIVFIIIAVIITRQLVHPSIAGGLMGLMVPFYSIPVMCLALTTGAVVGSRLSKTGRRAAIAVAIVLACVAFTLIRTGGVYGEPYSDLHWRWTKTPEERLLAQGDEPVTPNSTPALVLTNEGAKPGSEWPGFRGPNRDGVSRGVRIETDWSQHPPVEMWRRPIGPGWSSFAVSKNILYTQEQRGNDELVSAYHLGTGKPIWQHRDAARFWESNAGAGPRGTPTLANGRVYTLGATGILNALNAADGTVIFSRNAATDTGAKVPEWGFAGSPVVTGDTVIVATAGVLAAYDTANGNLRWSSLSGGRGYSSPHLSTIDGVNQVLMVNHEGLTSVAPADGAVLWKHVWEGDSIVQPAVTADGGVLIGSGSGLGSEVGVRRVALTRAGGGWTAGEGWTSIGLKPYFNDFVVSRDYAFGFDGSSIACIDLKNGERKWKGGSYGHGQIVLLADQDLLIVVSEGGDLALVKATPDQFTELSRFKALKGKTWNHPVLVGDVLLVRNSEEMAAFRVAPAKS